MGRIVLDLPEHFLFSTEIAVHISEINFANHVGADGMLALIQEARIGFLAGYGYREMDVEGRGIIITDSVVIYKSEACHGDILKVEIAVGDFSRYGCDFIYRVSQKKTGREVARAKTGILFFDYGKREKAEIPPGFKALFLPEG